MVRQNQSVWIIAAVKDALDLVIALFPIQLELHPEIVETGLVRGIEFAAAAIFGRAIEGGFELAVFRPEAHPLWLVILFRDPELALRRKCHAHGMVHLFFVIGPVRRFARLTDDAQFLAGRRKHFDLMALTVIGNEDVAVSADDDLFGIVESFGDESLLVFQTHAVFSIGRD